MFNYSGKDKEGDKDSKPLVQEIGNEEMKVSSSGMYFNKRIQELTLI